jgi:hypothetical protein
MRRIAKPQLWDRKNEKKADDFIILVGVLLGGASPVSAV